ncbi:winged helix-turn-helix domain-containing protein [Pseudoalteromonas phenolica]|uniref:winged helix-turn-helix domain-containing protein n=1 Tax=Pseudoalteromonas phenolica TaxID=161398 RepID=UPI0007176DB5|nr:winged helix-turn-helix domain-containing protein [Pseudoalteromonas phenolica]MBE0357577.1 hypothetical protein [Pseudoalteromonas phenolica O-BC30]
MLDANITQVKFADWLLLTRSCSLVSGGTTQELTPLNYKILSYFILNPNRIVSRDEFISSVWENHYVDDNAINKAISDLRRILKSSDSAQILIKTHYKKGYSFVCDVELILDTKLLSSDSAQHDLSEYSYENEKFDVTPHLYASRKLEKSSISAHLKQILYFKITILISIMVVSLFFIGYWFLQQPESLRLESKKLSISEDGIYASLNLSPSSEKLAVTKENIKTGIDEIFLIDLETHKNTKIISEQFDSYPIGWASNSNSIYYQIINNDKKVCEVWRADFKINNEVDSKEKVLECDSQYILSMVSDDQHNRMVYTKFGYRNVPSLSALVARDLSTGEEFQVTSPNIDSFGDRFVSLSPNKEKIAFVRMQTGYSQIYIAKLDGSMQSKIYESNVRINRVEWGEDSEELFWYVPSSQSLFTFDIKTVSLQEKSVSSKRFSNMITSQDVFLATTRTADADIYTFNTLNNELKQITDTRMYEFGPVIDGNIFYFFREDEELTLNYYLDNELKRLPSSLDINTVSSSDFNKSERTLALSHGNRVILYKPYENRTVDKFVFEKQVVHVSWFNDSRLLLIFEGEQSEQHIWMYDLDSEELQKIIHSDAYQVAQAYSNKIIYQDFYTNLHLFDPTEGTSKLLLSVPNNPYIKWCYLDEHIYYSTGKNLIKYSLETQKETSLFGKNLESEKFILDFSVDKNESVEKFILQIHTLKSNEVVLLEAF